MENETEQTTPVEEHPIPIIMSIAATATIISANANIYMTITIFGLAALVIYTFRSHLDMSNEKFNEQPITPIEGLSFVALLFFGGIFYITSQIVYPILFLSLYFQFVNRIL